MLEEGRWFRAAWFAQQAVEKALKALYPLVAGSEPPRLSSVTELYRGLRRSGFRLPAEAEERLGVLNKYYTVTRYPDAANGLPSESVDRFEAERAVELARRVLRVVEEAVRAAEEEGLEDAVRAATRLIEELERRGLRIVEAYLFGSRVRGDHLETSDVDLVLVSPGFRGVRYIDRLELVYRVEWEAGIEPWVEVVAVTPEELVERLEGSSVLRDARRYWLRLR